MPYQNNNNRLVPQQQGLTSIKPAAQYTNHLVTVRPDYTQAQGLINTANALSDLGKGLVNFDNMMQRGAQSSAIDLIVEDNTKGNNQHEWAEAEKRIKGLVKLNPYIKDSYHGLAVEEYRQSLIRNISSIPNAETLPSEEYAKILQEAQGKMIDFCKSNGIKTKNASNALIGFQKDINELQTKQQVIKADNNYKLAQKKFNEELVKGARYVIYNVPKEKQGQALKDLILNGAVTLTQTLGVDNQEAFLKCIYPSVETLIKQIATDDDIDYDLTDVLNMVKSIEIDGVNIDTIKPNWKYDLRQTYKTAVTQHHTEMFEDYKIQQLKKQQAVDKAEDEFHGWYFSNPKATYVEMEAKVKEITEQSGEPSVYDNLMKITLNMKNMASSLEDAWGTSDKGIMNRFASLYIQEDLTPETIMQAHSAGLLNYKDALAWYTKTFEQENRKYQEQERIIRKREHDLKMQQAEEENKAKNEAKKEAEAAKSYKSLLKDMDNRLYTKEGKLDSAEVNALKKIGRIEEVRADIEAVNQLFLNREASYSDCYEMLKTINKEASNMIARYTAITQTQNQVKEAEYSQITAKSNKNAKYRPIDLLNKDKRKVMGYIMRTDYNSEKAAKAFNAMGMFGNPVSISSTMQASRSVTIKGKTYKRPHQAYDIALPVGTKIKLPKGVKYGKVISSGYQKELGHYTLIQLGKNGEYGYIRLAHLSQVFDPGMEIGAGGIMAVSGNSGLSSGSHVDIQMWGNDLNSPHPLKAAEFLTLLNATK